MIQKSSFLSIENTLFLRGFAIFLVIIQHIGGVWTNLFTPLGGTGVSIFLILSGFGLSESFKKIKLSNYWPKKILRVFLPYLLFESLFYFIDGTRFSSYILDISGIKTSYWYIGYILKWYILFYLGRKFLPKYYYPALLVVAMSFLFLLPEIEAEQSFSFIIGVFISNKYEYFKNLKKGFVIKIALITFIIGMAFLFIKQFQPVRAFHGTSVYNIIQCFIKLPLALSLISIFSILSKLSNFQPLIFLGVISYELYIVHIKLIHILGSSIRNMSSLLYLISITFAFFIVSILLSYWFQKYNEFISHVIKTKLPYYKYTFRLSKRAN